MKVLLGRTRRRSGKGKGFRRDDHAKMKNKRSRKRTLPGSHFAYYLRYLREDATDRSLTVGMSRTSDGEMHTGVNSASLFFQAQQRAICRGLGHKGRDRPPYLQRPLSIFSARN